MTTLHGEKANALLTFLELAHATQYTGLDDDMADDCEEWISNLSDDEVCDLVLAVYHKGL